MAPQWMFSSSLAASQESGRRWVCDANWIAMKVMEADWGGFGGFDDGSFW